PNSLASSCSRNFAPGGTSWRAMRWRSLSSRSANVGLSLAPPLRWVGRALDFARNRTIFSDMALSLLRRHGRSARAILSTILSTFMRHEGPGGDWAGHYRRRPFG